MPTMIIEIGTAGPAYKRRGLPGQHEDAGADDRADAQRGEVAPRSATA